MDTGTEPLTCPDVARLGRVCGRLDAARGNETCAVAMIETPLWRQWSEQRRRLWEFAYFCAQTQGAARRSRD
jgi:hypothetical protein